MSAVRITVESISEVYPVTAAYGMHVIELQLSVDDQQRKAIASKMVGGLSQGDAIFWVRAEFPHLFIEGDAA